MIQQLCLLAISAVSASQQGQPSYDPAKIVGKVVEIRNFKSKILPTPRNIDIYLPPNYDSDPDRRFPVFYLSDGQALFRSQMRADETLEAMIKSKLIEPIIVVGIHSNEKRSDEYLPTRITMGNEGEMGGMAPQFGKMLIEEIMPMIKESYRIDPEPDKTSFGGASFGGVLALYLATQYPGHIGNIVAMSPSLWVDPAWMNRQFQDPKLKLPKKLWLDMGGEEGNAMLDRIRQFVKVLTDRGARTGEQFIYYEEPGGSHSSAAWGRRFPSILTYLYGTGK